MDGQVERILGHFEYKSEKFYIIQWKTRFPTFQQVDDLRGCELLLEQYWEDMALLELLKMKHQKAQCLKFAFEHVIANTHPVQTSTATSPLAVTDNDAFTGKTEDDYELVDISFGDAQGVPESEQPYFIEMHEAQSGSNSPKTEDSPERKQVALAATSIKIVSTKSLAAGVRKKYYRPKQKMTKGQKKNKKNVDTSCQGPKFFVRCHVCKKYGCVSGILGHGKSKHKMPDNACPLCGILCNSKAEFDVHFEHCKRAGRKPRSLLRADQVMTRGRPPAPRPLPAAVVENPGQPCGSKILE